MNVSKSFIINIHHPYRHHLQKWLISWYVPTKLSSNFPGNLWDVRQFIVVCKQTSRCIPCLVVGCFTKCLYQWFFYIHFHLNCLSNLHWYELSNVQLLSKVRNQILQLTIDWVTLLAAPMWQPWNWCHEGPVHSDVFIVSWILLNNLCWQEFCLWRGRVKVCARKFVRLCLCLLPKLMWKACSGDDKFVVRLMFHNSN